MLVYSASTSINASPETIWQIITDGPNYPQWDPHIDHIEGTIASGKKITAYTKLSPRAFPVTVSVFEPGRKMVWSSAMPLGLFSGKRTFSLTPQGDSTEFGLREEFDGLLLPVMSRSIPDMNPIFADFVKGLKAQAEKTQS
jgi:hypothetical protein